jgi:NAD(P)-dependent dehydrogenase (short-subunit alcohol dehydrogenase family)
MAGFANALMTNTLMASAPMIVVGANGAIGDGLARAAHDAGHPLYTGDLNPRLSPELGPLVESGDVAFETLDVTNRSEVSQFVQGARNRFGEGEEIIVVPAQGLGWADEDPRVKAGIEAGRNPITAVNVDGCEYLFDAVLRQFDGAKILYVGFSSIVDIYQVDLGGNSYYRDSKRAMREMGTRVAQEHDHVNALTIAPGLVVSEMTIEGIATTLLISAVIQAAAHAETQPESRLRQGLAGFLETEAISLPSDPSVLLGEIFGEAYLPVERKVAKTLASRMIGRPGKGIAMLNNAGNKLINEPKRDDTSEEADARRARSAQIKQIVARALIGSELAVDPTTFGQVILDAIHSGNYDRIVEIYRGREPYNEGPIVDLFEGLPLMNPIQRIEV